MKYQVLFSLKNNERVFINVVCCSRDCRFKNIVKAQAKDKGGLSDELRLQPLLPKKLM